MLFKLRLDNEEDFKSFRVWGEIVKKIGMKGKPIFEDGAYPREYPATLLFSKKGKKVNYDFVYLRDFEKDVDENEEVVDDSEIEDNFTFTD